MDDKLEIRLKALLPYIIVIGAVFLLSPLLMSKTAGASTYIIQLGVFPLVSLGSGTFYKIRNKHSELYLCAVAPLFYALTALLYGMWHEPFTVIVYIAAYLLCGYMGQMIADIFPAGKTKTPADSGARKAPRKTADRPRRVRVENGHAAAEPFRAQDPDRDDSLDTATTEDDIEAILKSIHDRKQ